jgi:hypothetical protein
VTSTRHESLVGWELRSEKPVESGTVFEERLGLEVHVAIGLLALSVGATSLAMQSPGMGGSWSAEKSVHPFAVARFGIRAFEIGAFDINTATATRWVVHQVVLNRRPRRTAQLCFACRSHAKVSWFPLTDWLAERSLAWIWLFISS